MVLKTVVAYQLFTWYITPIRQINTANHLCLLFESPPSLFCSLSLFLSKALGTSRVYKIFSFNIKILRKILIKLSLTKPAGEKTK